MSIYLTNQATGDTIDLPDDLLWVNEFGWTPVLQKSERSITGALIVDSAVKVGGRPIVLQGAEDDWMLRADGKALIDAWISLPGQDFLLTIHGRQFAVVFDHEAGPLEMKPLVGYSDPEDGDPYCNVTLRFLEI